MERAYRGETFFWGLLPQPGDQLTFTFSEPILLKRLVLHRVVLHILQVFVCFRYLFRSGNAEHPSDKFYNTTVEVLPTNPILNAHNVTNDGYVIIGK